MPLMAADSRALARAVLVAGLVAGLLAGAFHLVVSERFVNRAIALEAEAEQRELEATGATAERHEEVFSRRTQKVGLLVGALTYGIAAGAVFAGVYALFAPRLPGRIRRVQIALLGGAAAIAVALVPFLKYPANPPGVGDPGTLTQRQLLYVGCVLLAIAGLWVAVRVAVSLRGRMNDGVAVSMGAAVYLVWVAALLLLLPDRADPVNTPARLLWQFRVASLSGQILFWLCFSAVFASVLPRGGAREVSTAPLRSP